MPKTRCASCQDEHPPYNTLIQLFTPERIATPSLHRGIFHFVLRRLHYELFGHNYYLHNFSLVSFRSAETVRVRKWNKLKPFGNLLYTLNCVGLISLEHSLRDATRQAYKLHAFDGETRYDGCMKAANGPSGPSPAANRRARRCLHS